MIRTLTTVVTAGVCLAASPSAGLRPVAHPTDHHPHGKDDGHRSADDFARLAETDPVGMLSVALRRYKAEVRGFRATLHKRERVGGVLFEPEAVRVAVREQPFAVLFLWDEGARSAQVGGLSLGKVEGVLYAAGENDGQMLAWRPGALFAPVTPAAPTGGPARAASRYAVTEAGLGHVLDRTRRSWAAARDDGRLVWKYGGTREVPELGGRVCHVVTRTCDPAEADPFLSSETRPAPGTRPGEEFATVTVMVDAERWLQVGSEQRAANGDLIGSYYFRDVDLNPAFGPDQFTAAAFRK